MNDAAKFFLKEKPVRALLLIENMEETYCSQVSEEIDATYAHTVKIISELEEKDILETRKSGRKKLVKLSDKGQKFASAFSEVMNLYEDHDPNERKTLDQKDLFSK